VAELKALVEEHPFRERLRVLLVKALYAAGRQADALEAYAQARRCLVDEVGLEPGPELRAVEAAVLAQDSALVATPARPAAAPPAPVTPLVGRERDLATLRSVLTVARRHLGGTASVLEAMAVLDHDKGDYRRAAVELAEARALRSRTGTAPSPALHDQLSRVVRSLAVGLGSPDVPNTH
jgi:hypothetical protein